MDRSVRIAKALGRAHDKLRQIFNQESCLKVLTGDQQAYTLVTTYDSHWYLDKREFSDVIAQKRFKKIYVDDVEGCRLAQLKTATAFQIGEDIYTFHGKDSFTGKVPSYEFKVVHKGPRI